MTEPTKAVHGYFLLQVQAIQDGPGEVRGVLEDLRTGQRYPFANLKDLTGLVDPRPAAVRDRTAGQDSEPPKG